MYLVTLNRARFPQSFAHSLPEKDPRYPCGFDHSISRGFNKIALPPFLGFFGGSRFVPIVSFLAAIVVGAIMTVVWPHFQQLIFGLGGLVDATGYPGTLLYGFILRMPGLFGLHHIFYLPFWTTALGGRSSTGSWLKVRSVSSSLSLLTQPRDSFILAHRVLCQAALSP